MCIDQQLSERRLRRRKTFRKVRRAAERRLGIFQARQHKIDREDRDVLPDGRSRLLTRATELEILEDVGFLAAAVQPEPQPYVTSPDLIKAATASRRRQDAADARRFAEQYPFAGLSAA